MSAARGGERLHAFRAELAASLDRDRWWGSACVASARRDKQAFRPERQLVDRIGLNIVGARWHGPKFWPIYSQPLLRPKEKGAPAAGWTTAPVTDITSPLRRRPPRLAVLFRSVRADRQGIAVRDPLDTQRPGRGTGVMVRPRSTQGAERRARRPVR